MKKKVVIGTFIVICMFLLLFVLIKNIQNQEKQKVSDDTDISKLVDNKETTVHVMDTESVIANIDIESETAITNNTETVYDTESTIENTDVEWKGKDIFQFHLLSDEGMTIGGVPATYDYDITSQANIAYLLGCEDISETTDFEKYISENFINDGVYTSSVTGYPVSDNPYDFIKTASDIVKESLMSVDLDYDVKDNYLIDNHQTDELSARINKIINGDKKIIIGVLPAYYVYINHEDGGLAMGGNFTNTDYVFLKPYNDIYTFIINTNHFSNEDFIEIFENMYQIMEDEN